MASRKGMDRRALISSIVASNHILDRPSDTARNLALRFRPFLDQQSIMSGMHGESRVPDYWESRSTYHGTMFGNDGDAIRGANWISDDSDDRMSNVICGTRFPIFSLRSDSPYHRVDRSDSLILLAGRQCPHLLSILSQGQPQQTVATSAHRRYIACGVLR